MQSNLASVHQSLDVWTETQMGSELSRIEENALRVVKRTGQLLRWLRGREIDTQRLVEQMELVSQNALVEQICGQMKVQKKGSEEGLKPRLSIPWHLYGKDAICEGFCGT